MKFRKILVFSFLTVTVVSFGGCRAQNEDCLIIIDQKQCVCDPKASTPTFPDSECRAQNEDCLKQCVCDSEVSTPTVPDILLKNKSDPDVHNDNYRRKIIFIYKNVLNNETKIHIPNSYNQKLIPNPPIHKNDELITFTDETVNDKFFNDPDQVTLENAVPRPMPIEIDKIIKVLPEKPINPVDLNREVPINFREELWPVSPKNILQAKSRKIQPIHSNEEEPALPINYSKDFRAGSHIRNLIYSGKKGSGESVQVPYLVNFQSPKINEQMPNYYKLGNHIIMVHPGYSQVEQPYYGHKRNKYRPYTIQVPPSSSYKIRDQYSEPGNLIMVPHLNKFHQNNVKPYHSGGQKHIAPMNYGKVIWPWSHMNVPHYFNDREAGLPVNIPYPYPLLQDSSGHEPKYSKEVPHSHLHHPGDIKPIDSGKQDPEYSEDIPHSHPFYPTNLKPVSSDDQEPGQSEEVPHSHTLHPDNIKPIDSGEQKPENSEEVPSSHPLHQSDIKSVSSGEQEPENTKEVPDSHSLHLGDIESIDSGEEKPENSEDIPYSHPFHPSDIEFMNSGKQKPKDSEEVPGLHPLHSNDIKSVDSGEQESKNTKEVPDSHSLRPYDIKPIYSGEQKPEDSKKVPDLHHVHPNDLTPVGSDEQKPENSDKVLHSYLLHPDDIEPIDSGVKKPENFIEVSHSHSLHSDDNEPIDSSKQKPENFTEIPNSHSLHLGDVVPIGSGEQKPKNSEDVPHSYPLHPGDIVSINSGEQKPEDSEEVPGSHPLHPNDIKSVGSGEQDPEITKEVPDSHSLHSDDIKPIDSSKQKPETSKGIPHSHSFHLGDVVPIGSGEQKPENSEDVPHSHPLHPSKIESIDSGEQKHEDLEGVPGSHPLHPNDIKSVGSGEQDPENTKEVPHLHPIHSDDIKPIDSGEQKPKNSEDVPHSHLLHPSDLKPVGSDEQKPGNSKEVPHSHPLYPGDIKPIHSGEQKPVLSVEIPDSHPLHPSDIKPVDTDEQKSENSEEVPHSNPLHPDNIEPIDSGKQEPEYSEEVSHSHSVQPSNINSVHPGEQETSNSKEVPNSYPLYPIDINPVRPGKQEHVQVSYPVKIKDKESKIVFHKHRPDGIQVYPTYSNNIKLNYHEMMQNQIPRKYKWTVNNPNVYYKWKKPFLYKGYKTFDEWFREEIHRLKNNNNNIDIKSESIRRLVLKMFKENGMFVAYGGVLKDLKGRILYMQNFKLRPVLIGNSMNVDNLPTVGYPNNAISTWSEYVVLTMLHPPKTLGIIPFGTAIYPSSSPLDSFASKLKSPYDSTFVPKIVKKKVHKRESPNYLLPQKVVPRPVKINQPESQNMNTEHITKPHNQNMNTDVSEDGAVKTSSSYDKSVENFLRNMLHYSPSRKVYVKRKYLSKDDQSQLNNFIGESSKTPLNSKRFIQKNEHELRHQHPHAPIQNDDDFESHYSPSRKVYVKRKDLSKDNQWQLNNFISESSKTPLNSKRFIQKNEHELRHQHPHAPIQNDDDFESHYSPSRKVYVKRKDLSKDDQSQLNDFTSESSKTLLNSKRLIPKNEHELRTQHSHAPIQNDDDFESHYSPSRKVYVKRKDLSKDNQSQLNNFIGESSETPFNSKRLVLKNEDGPTDQHPHALIQNDDDFESHYSPSRKVDFKSKDNQSQVNNFTGESSKTHLNSKRLVLKNEDGLKNQHQHAPIQNDDDFDLIRIIGGSSAIRSGIALNNKGRTAEQQQPNNNDIQNLKIPKNLKDLKFLKKHFHDYINWEELHRDDSLVRIIGGNAATGSGHPLSNKGRSGAPLMN